MKILKGIGGHPHDRVQPWGKYAKFTLLDAPRNISRGLFALGFMHLISNGLNEVNINSLTYIVALL